jgi:hypothetical protein
MPEPTCPLPARAYNLSLLHEQRRTGPNCHGWCFGLPPGISPGQWPLDPQTGYPLVHGFTLRLPDDYRCHGADIAGFSFFAFCSEHSDGGTDPDEAILSAMTGNEPPEDARYRPFWDAAQNEHPRLYRMKDILDESYALILLTETELHGKLCAVPDTSAAESLSCHTAPAWLKIGSALAFVEQAAFSSEYYTKILGVVPEARPEWSRALQWTPRAVDPNAGKAPEDPFASNKTSGYQQPYYYEGGIAKSENWRTHAWTADHARNHIGGTMRPVQATPRFSPFYVEFDEYLGGYNFGGGNCQLDFLNMRFDWACG